MTARWNDRSTHRVQTDNSIESILRKSGVRSWLETCGPTSATIACDVTSHPVNITTPGGSSVQGEDVLTLWLNDPANVAALRAARPGVDPSAYMDNEIIQYYPAALKAVFDADAEVLIPASFDDVVAAAKAGNAVMIHLTKPAHYLCVVAVDEASGELVYRDPWPGRTGTNGFNLKMSKAEFQANVQNSIVIVHP